MRTAIKITLNSADVFDAVIWNYLKDKKNKAGHLKKIIYDSIMRTLKDDDVVKQAGAPTPEDPIQNEEEKVVNEKLSKILNY